MNEKLLTGKLHLKTTKASCFPPSVLFIHFINLSFYLCVTFVTKVTKCKFICTNMHYVVLFSCVYTFIHCYGCTAKCNGTVCHTYISHVHSIVLYIVECKCTVNVVYM